MFFMSTTGDLTNSLGGTVTSRQRQRFEIRLCPGRGRTVQGRPQYDGRRPHRLHRHPRRRGRPQLGHVRHRRRSGCWTDTLRGTRPRPEPPSDRAGGAGTSIRCSCDISRAAPETFPGQFLFCTLPPMNTPDKPLLVYDGQCAFCRMWIDRWKTITGDSVEYVTSAEYAARVDPPDAPDDGAGRASRPGPGLRRSDRPYPLRNSGKASSSSFPTVRYLTGARAVLTAIGTSTAGRILLLLHNKISGVPGNRRGRLPVGGRPP